MKPRCYCRAGHRAWATHVKGCRPGRPRCRYRRPVPCDCPAYKFPHRQGSGLCGNRDAFAALRYGPSLAHGAVATAIRNGESVFGLSDSGSVKEKRPAAMQVQA